uniref:SID1 transmembrane family member 1 n=1 Tax=Caenorhabditis tropicalis TaxID=1561998 RepID=A0A1I7U027_9PELO
MAILNLKLRFLLIGYSFIFSLCDTIHDLKLDNEYHGLSTKGNLTSDLYRVKLDPKSLPPAIRVAISSENTTIKNPLSVEVIHGNTIHHIALPRVQSQVEKSFSYWFASDTLCDYNSSIQELESPVYLYILSSEPATFDLRVKSVPDFNIGTKPVTTLASPSEPRYYKYTFPDDVEKVDMKIESNSQLCGKVIVRRVNCPLFDAAGLAQLNDIYFYQTFTTFGGFSLLKSFIGPEFHLAFTVLSDDSVCGTQSNSSDHGGGLARIKSATISVTPVEETSFWSSVPILLCTFILCIIGSVLTKLDIMGLDIINDNNQSEPRRNSGTGQPARQNIGADDDQMGQIDDAVYIIPRNVDEREEPGEDADDPHARVEQDIRPLIEIPRVRVSHKEYQESVIKESAYFNFYFFQLFGSILPGLTTLFYKQQQASNYMNLDMCYLNYLCYSDVFIFNSMNGMLSAFSLAIVGIFNLFIVFRNISLKQDSSDQPEEARQPNVTGVQERKASKVVVLLGLVALGFQWAIINDCPHKITIHLYIYTCSWLFYSAFMWIYSLRHGVKKWQQYYIIGVSSAFGCITMAKNVTTIKNDI